MAHSPRAEVIITIYKDNALQILGRLKGEVAVVHVECTMHSQ